ncbi:MAG: hypothetical protein IJI67_06325 [Clostridia bacterium]|nr:hypothetical protein [Clostridia bacterium]
MYEVWVGTVSETCKTDWFSAADVTEAFEKVLVKEIVCIGEVLSKAKDYLIEERQVDWGAWLWRGTKAQIQALFSQYPSTRGILLSVLEEGKLYAVAYVELD